MDNETENNGEGIQEDSIKTLEQEYNTVFNSLKTAYKAFVTSYLVSLDGRKAAEDAGYSKKCANKQGQRLLQNKTIALCIRLQQRINSLQGKVSVTWVLEQLKVRYDQCVLDKREQAATANLNLIGQHLGMFGKGKEGGDLHLHDHKKYVNYPPVPESIEAWVAQMKQVGYDAALPVPKEEEGEATTSTSTKMVDTQQGEDKDEQVQGMGTGDSTSVSKA